MLTLFADPDCQKFMREHPDEFASYGCGPGGVGDYLVPDTVWGLSIKPTCQIHDHGYRHGENRSEEARARYDRILLNNGIRIIRYHTKNKLLLRLRLRRIHTYYIFVKIFGGPAYWDEDRNDPEQLITI